MVDTPTSDTNVGEPDDAARLLSEAAEVVAAVEDGEEKDRVTLSNGIVLKLRPVPPLAIREIAVRFAPPPVPVVWIADKERDEPNPNDPDYLAAMTRYLQDQTYRVADVSMALGTAVESVPEFMERPESDGWIEPLEAVGLVIDRDNRHKRYLAWLRLYAVTSNADLTRVMRGVTMLAGVTEEEVQRAVRAFRGSP